MLPNEYVPEPTPCGEATNCTCGCVEGIDFWRGNLTVLGIDESIFNTVQVHSAFKLALASGLRERAQVDGGDVSLDYMRADLVKRIDTYRGAECISARRSCKVLSVEVTIATALCDNDYLTKVVPQLAFTPVIRKASTKKKGNNNGGSAASDSVVADDGDVSDALGALDDGDGDSGEDSGVLISNTNLLAKLGELLPSVFANSANDGASKIFVSMGKQMTLPRGCEVPVVEEEEETLVLASNSKNGALVAAILIPLFILIAISIVVFFFAKRKRAELVAEIRAKVEEEVKEYGMVGAIYGGAKVYDMPIYGEDAQRELFQLDDDEPVFLPDLLAKIGALSGGGQSATNKGPTIAGRSGGGGGSKGPSIAARSAGEIHRNNDSGGGGDIGCVYDADLGREEAEALILSNGSGPGTFLFRGKAKRPDMKVLSMLIPGGMFEHHLMKPGLTGVGSFVMNKYELPSGVLSEIVAHLKTTAGAAAAQIETPLTVGVLPAGAGPTVDVDAHGLENLYGATISSSETDGGAPPPRPQKVRDGPPPRLPKSGRDGDDDDDDVDDHDYINTKAQSNGGAPPRPPKSGSDGDDDDVDDHDYINTQAQSNGGAVPPPRPTTSSKLATLRTANDDDDGAPPRPTSKYIPEGSETDADVYSSMGHTPTKKVTLRRHPNSVDDGGGIGGGGDIGCVYDADLGREEAEALILSNGSGPGTFLFRGKAKRPDMKVLSMLIPGGMFEHHLMKPGLTGVGSFVMNKYELPSGVLSEIVAHLKTTAGAAAAQIETPLTVGVHNEGDL